MLNLNQTKKIIRRLSPVAGVFLLISILSSLIFIRYFSKPTPQIPDNIPPSPNIFQDTRQKQPATINFFNLDKIQLPKKLPVFTFSKIALNEQDYIKTATEFGFNQDPILIEDTIDGKQYNWSKDNLHLSINQSSIRFSNSTKLFTNKKLSLIELQNIANKFINDLSLVDKSIQLDEKGTLFLNLKDEDFESSNSIEKAKFVELNYFKRILDYPVYYGQPEAPLTKIRINTDGTIIYFETRLYTDIKEQNKYDLKDIKTAAQEIKNGQGKIVKTVLPDSQGYALELYRIQPVDIKTLDIKNIYPAFFISSEKNNTIQPIYVFEGDFDFTPDQKGKAVLYLPSIKNE